MFSFLDRLPGNGRKSTLEEGIVYDVVLVVFSFDDPVTRANLTLSQIGDYRGSLRALTRLYQQRSSCTKCIHRFAPPVLNTDKIYLNIQPIKMAQRQPPPCSFSLRRVSRIQASGLKKQALGVTEAVANIAVG